ncbi:MAG: hypothetical protein WKG00_13165 [Polyangiaceae bacterium]
MLPARHAPVLVARLALAIAALLHAPSLHADEDDLGHAPIPLDARDVPPHEMWDAGEGSGPWVAIEGGAVVRSEGKREVGGMLLVGLPFDRWARRRARAEAGGALAQVPPRLDEPVRPRRRAAGSPALEPSAAAPAPPLPAPESPAPDPPPLVLRVTPTAARAAVRAALRQARLEDAEARIDSLASRARSSALLPELRLRATRLLDEAESLSPTEYDPGRTTATGGTSTWLEARATWRLDRLVFADEEVPLERLRHDRAEAEARVAARTLELLFAWQRALTVEADLARPVEERVEATLRVLECEASLDVVTDGWFSRWRGKVGR